MTKQDFINKVRPVAVRLYREGNCLPSLTIAQACLESAFGKSAPGNMLFGIKWSQGYASQLLWTHEYINSIRVRVQAKFRAYSSWDDSIIDHAKLFTKKRYEPVLEADNYIDACNAVHQCGYATSPTYAKDLIKMIEVYKLNQWDGNYMCYKKIAFTHIVELDPMMLKATKIYSTGVGIAKTFHNFVNANFFSGKSTIGWLISEGKVLNERHEYKTWKGNPKGTLIIYEDGKVEVGLKYDSEIAPLVGGIWFCCQGFNLFPLDIVKEGFSPATVGYKTNRVSIGYNKTTNKIIIAVRPSSDSKRAVQTMTNLGCKGNAICLDSGGSVNLSVGNKLIYKTDRQLTNILYW
jgi:exopolysaccharide biosynthesis protein